MNILLLVLAALAWAEDPKVAPAPFADPVTDDASFRDPSGYPKQRAVFSVQPRSIAGTHSVSGNEFSFRGYGVGLGVGYEFHASRRLSIGLEYQHLDLRVENSDSKTNSVQSSNAALDSVDLSARYCFFGNTNFFQQICPGVDLAREAFPTLIPQGGGAYQIGRVYDLIGGFNLSYQSPVGDQVVFRAAAGYGFGTGMARAGDLAPRSDSRYYLRLGGRWEPLARHALGGDVEWNNRSITVRDKATNDLETSKSTDLGLRLSYAYTF